MPSINIDKNVGAKLKCFREELDMSQGVLAKKIGFGSAAVISNYERGTRSVSPDFMNKMYKLGMDLNWFVSGECGETPVRKNNVNVLEKACFDAEKVQLDLLYSSKNKPSREELELAFKSTFISLVEFYNSNENKSRIQVMESHDNATKPLLDLFKAYN